jgi:hypothetical protein
VPQAALDSAEDSHRALCVKISQGRQAAPRNPLGGAWHAVPNLSAWAERTPGFCKRGANSRVSTPQAYSLMFLSLFQSAMAPRHRQRAQGVWVGVPPQRGCSPSPPLRRNPKDTASSLCPLDSHSRLGPAGGSLYGSCIRSSGCPHHTACQRMDHGPSGPELGDVCCRMAQDYTRGRTRRLRELFEGFNHNTADRIQAAVSLMVP